MADAPLTLEPDSLRLNLDPLHCAICREWLPQGELQDADQDHSAQGRLDRPIGLGLALLGRTRPIGQPVEFG